MYEGILVCKCGHGKPHHNGKYGNCTYDIGHYKNEKLCSCQYFDLDFAIYKGKRYTKEEFGTLIV